jgi:hypothetical protein
VRGLRGRADAAMMVPEATAMPPLPMLFLQPQFVKKTSIAQASEW